MTVAVRPLPFLSPPAREHYRVSGNGSAPRVAGCPVKPASAAASLDRPGQVANSLSQQAGVRLTCSLVTHRWQARRRTRSAISASGGDHGVGQPVSEDMPSSITESTMGHSTALLAFYATLMTFAVWNVSSGEFPGWLAQSGVAVLWAGMVLAISWMEAWVKFRAPLLAKHVGYDVGRHVFRGLNSMETALAGALLALCFVSDTDYTFPVALSSILLSQVWYLTPQLERAAFHKIVSATTAADMEQNDFLIELRGIVADSAAPPKYLHIIYVVLEGVKVVLLLSFALSLCSLH